MNEHSNHVPLSGSSANHFRKLKLALLAGTCLSAASTASAATVIESTDFGNSFTTATLMPTGIDMVTGVVTNSSDDNDYISFTDLVGGSAFTFNGNASGGYFELLDSTANIINSGFSLPFNGVVPTNGILVARVNWGEGNVPISYNVSLTADRVPEPSTALLAGAAALAGTLRRRRSASLEK